MMLVVALALAQAAPCPLPDGWGVHDGVFGEQQLPNLISLDSSRIYWNAVPVTDNELAGYARRTRDIPGALLILRAAESDCAPMKHIAELVADSVDCTPDKCLVDFAGRRPPRYSPPAIASAPPAGN